MKTKERKEISKEEGEMTRKKTLASILCPMTGGFPVIGQDGYGGEADGSRVVFLGVLFVPSRAAAKKIILGRAIDIHWARYSARWGWEVSLAHWDDADEEDCFVHLGDSGAQWR